MNTYILFLNGFFTQRKDIEEFSNNLIDGLKVVTSMKVVIENKESVIIIFDSELEDKLLSEKVISMLSDSEVKLSFLFNSNNMIGSKIPEEVRDLIFSETPSDSILFIEIMAIERDYNLDEILDKIEKQGIKSLTKDEKKFLDNFKK